MNCTTKFVGLDVSKAIISVAVSDREHVPPCYHGTHEAVRKLVKRLGQPEELLMCYKVCTRGVHTFWPRGVQRAKFGLILLPNLPLKI